MPDQRSIAVWLKSERLLITPVSSHHIKMRFQHRLAPYTVDLTWDEEWVSLGAELMSDVVGPRQAEFHRFVHQLNAQLTGVKIAIEDERFILISEDFVEDLNKSNLLRNLYAFHHSHEFVIETLLKEAKRLGLKFKSTTH
jgi:hypothetical protein